MKYILLLLMAGCTAPGFIVTETKITVQGDKIHVQKLGKSRPLSDTTMVVQMISKK
jgi:hypothetical protein